MTDKDFELALQLQRQFDMENGGNHLLYKSPNIVKSPIREMPNLGCPDLELADPTPNIHALFVQFDKQFFYSSLSSVVVRWSKRMYSCAGICRYEGRGGFCDIALSEPLLKLRSRKNLIETLLHEMIHAYLFVVQKDRDREGHGPNFQSHMYRINKAANVNITIYHSFIEEVRLYQTHWWRCDGPCQNSKPFFGMVRRSSNRAPGPSDFWWKRHNELCGGTFIKIKEPEKLKRKRDNPKITETDNASKRTKNDLRQYFTPQNNDTDFNTPVKKHRPNDESIHVIDTNPNSFSTPVNNRNKVAETVRNHWSTKYSQNQSTKTSDIINLNNSTDFKINESFNKYTPPTNSSINNDSPKSYNEIFQDVYGKDICLTPENFKKNNNTPMNRSKFVECPLCNRNILKTEINNHIKICLGDTNFNDTDFIEEKTDLIDLTMISYDQPVTNNKNCPLCNKNITTDLEEHLEICLNQSFSNEDDNFSPKIETTDEDVVYLCESDNETDKANPINTRSTVPCPCCLNMIEESLMNTHLDTCLNVSPVITL